MTVQHNAPVTIGDKLLLTITEATQLLSIGRDKLDELIKAGDIRVIRLGSAIRIKRADLDAFVAQLQPDREIAELPAWIHQLANEGKGRRR